MKTKEKETTEEQVPCYPSGNPIVKMGDTIIVSSDTINKSTPTGVPLVVYSIPTGSTRSNGSFNVRSQDGKSFVVYNGYPPTIYGLADRKYILSQLKLEKEDLIKKTREVSLRINIYSKYETREEYITDLVQDLKDKPDATTAIINMIREADKIIF